METIIYTAGQKDKYTGEVYTYEQTTVHYKEGKKHSTNDQPAEIGIGKTDSGNKHGYKLWYIEGVQMRLSSLPTYVMMLGTSRCFNNPQYGETSLNIKEQLEGFVPSKFPKGTPNCYKTVPVHPDLVF